jgi:hypothetical protein
MYNLASGSFVKCASIRDQACKEFFYGQDGRTERRFGKMEGIIAGITSEVLRTGVLPRIESEDHLKLLIFVILLHNRTLYAAEMMNELFDKGLKRLVSLESPELANELRHVKAELRNPASWILSMTENGLPLTADLWCKLAINDSGLPFITSDNPVAFYNQFLEGHNAFGSATGLGCKGLQVFLPLSPRHLLVYYDGSVYKVGDKSKRTIGVARQSDVHALNLLQCANANTNIYFDGSISREQATEMIREASKYRRKKKAHVCGSIEPRNTPQGLVHVSVCYQEDIKCNLKPTFISIVRRSRTYSAGDRLRHVRDEEWPRLSAEFRARAEMGQFREDQFAQFLQLKPGSYGDRARSVMKCLKNLAV